MVAPIACNKKIFLGVCLFTFLFFLEFFFSSLVQANPGDLDTDFGTDGVMITDVNNGNDDGIEVIVIQDDGKIVVAGYSTNGSDSDFSLARYDESGDLDPDFGDNGIVMVDMGSSIYEKITGMGIQSNGKIVAAGHSSTDVALACFQTSGSLDTTFGTSGKVTTDYSDTTSRIYAMSLQSDGRIIVAGTSDGDFVLLRYKTNGSLDTTFGDNGIITTDFDGNTDTVYALAVQSDGKIVAVGYTLDTSSSVDCGDELCAMTVPGSDVALARYSTNGDLDSNFGNNGKLTTDVQEEDYAYALAIQSDGKIIITGSTILIRYEENGTLDVDFGDNGIVEMDIESNAIAIQEDDAILVAGNKDNGSDNDFALVRYEPDGSLDTSFGDDGTIVTSFEGGNNDSILALNIQDDGKIVAAGQTDNGDDTDFALARYLSDDTSADDDGGGSAENPGESDSTASEESTGCSLAKNATFLASMNGLIVILLFWAIVGITKKITITERKGN